MVADMVPVTALSVPVLALGFALGVHVTVAGVLTFLLVAGLHGLAFTGFHYLPDCGGDRLPGGRRRDVAAVSFTLAFTARGGRMSRR